MTSIMDWAEFLRDRIAEERQRTESAAIAFDGVSGQEWALTDAGARRFGVQAVGGRVFAPVLTGRGHWADHEVALHIVRNQPLRTLDDLDAKAAFVDVLDHLDNHGAAVAGELQALAKAFAAPYREHPDHPEYVPPEES